MPLHFQDCPILVCVLMFVSMTIGAYEELDQECVVFQFAWIELFDLQFKTLNTIYACYPSLHHVLACWPVM